MRSQRRFLERAYCGWASADQPTGLEVRLILWNAVLGGSAKNMAINR
jgi:hypothetical protein